MLTCFSACVPRENASVKREIFILVYVLNSLAKHDEYGTQCGLQKSLHPTSHSVTQSPYYYYCNNSAQRNEEK